MAIIVIGLILIASFLLAKLVWRNRLITGLVLVGLLPGLAVGYYFGQKQIPITRLPSSVAEVDPSGDQRVVISLQEPKNEEIPEVPIQGSEGDPISQETTEEPIEESQSVENVKESQAGAEEVAPAPDEPTSSAIPEDTPPAEPEAEVLDEGFPQPRPKPVETIKVADPTPVTDEAILDTPDPQISEAIDPRMLTARDHMELGSLIVEDHPGGAISSYAKGLALYKEMEAYPEVGRALLDLGYAHVLKGEFGAAQNYSLEALEVADKIDDDFVKIRALINLGFVNMNKREPGNALVFYNQALGIAEKYGNSESLATLLENIGYAYAAENQPVKAHEHLVRALDVANAVGATSSSTRISNYLENN
jgi:hypothetical protein